MRLLALSAVVANMSTLVLTLVSSTLRVRSSLVSKEKRRTAQWKEEEEKNVSIVIFLIQVSPLCFTIKSTTS
jgi:hypothetical protein